MQEFEFTSPDGQTYIVMAPPGGTREEAFARLQQQLSQTQSSSLMSEPIIGGFQRGLRDPLDAGAQMLERILPEQAVSGINRLNNWLVDMGVPLERLGEEGLGGQLANLEAQYQRGRGGEFDLARLLGNLAGGAAAGILAGPSIAVSTPARLAGGTLAGFTSGTLSEPVKPEDMEQFWGEKLRQGQWGAAGGAAGTTFGNLFSGLGARARSPDVEQLRAMGVEPTVGQTLGEATSRAEEKAISVPFLGGSVRAARERALEQYNQAAINEALQPLGARVSASGHEGVQEANRIVSRAYEDAADLSRGVMLDEQASSEIANLRQLLGGAPEQVERDFERFFTNTFERRLGSAAGFEPVIFKKLESDLSKKIKANKGELQDAYREMQRILRAAAARQDPQYSAALSAANAAYARMRRISEAAKRAKLNEGVFTPGQLVGAAMMQDPRAGKAGIAEGTAMMQELGRLGQRVLGDVVPNSGTADRLLPGVGVGGIGVGAFYDPTIMAAALASGLGTGAAMLGSRPGPQAAINAALRGLPGHQYIMQPGVLGGIIGTELEKELFK